MRLLIKDIRSTYELESNTRIQLENFNDKSCRSTYLDPKYPVGLVNSVWYLEEVTPQEDAMVDLLEDLKASNIFLTVKNW